MIEDQKQLLARLMELTEKCNLNIVELKTEVKNLKQEVDEVSKVVKDGNGTPPLTTRVAVLENKVGRQVEDSKRFQNHRWTFVLTLLTAGSALVASLITLFAK